MLHHRYWCEVKHGKNSKVSVAIQAVSIAKQREVFKVKYVEMLRTSILQQKLEIIFLKRSSVIFEAMYGVNIYFLYKPTGMSDVFIFLSGQL